MRMKETGEVSSRSYCVNGRHGEIHSRRDRWLSRHGYPGSRRCRTCLRDVRVLRIFHMEAASANQPVKAIIEDESMAPKLTVGQATPGNYMSVPSSPGWVAQCSIRWVTRQNNVITAGHCLYDPYDAHPITSLGRTVSNGGGDSIGTTAPPFYKKGSQDVGRIHLYSGAGGSGTGYYANYRGGKNRIQAVRPVVTDLTVCKYGITTGEECGPVVSPLDYRIYSYNNQTIRVNNSATAAACSKPGDSGGPVVYPNPNNNSQGIAGMSSGTNGSCGLPSWHTSHGLLTHSPPTATR